MVRFVCSFWCFLCLSTVAYRSAEAGWWSWKVHRVLFWLPHDMRVTHSTSHKYSAKSSLLVFKMVPFRSAVVSSHTMAQKGYASYHFLRQKKIIGRKRIRVRGGWMYILTGEGLYANKEVVRFLVAGFASSKSISHFYIRMWWGKASSRVLKKRINQVIRSVQMY